MNCELSYHDIKLWSQPKIKIFFLKFYILLKKQITFYHPKLYTRYYTMHLKLFECTLCTLNYHTLYPGVTFIIKLDRN